MHAAWSALESALPVISLIVVAAGIAGGSFRISQNARTVSVYRDAAQAWQAKAESLAADVDTLTDENRDLRRRNRDLEDDLREARDREAPPRGARRSREQQ